MYQYDLDPETGVDNMRFLAGITNEEKRQAAETALLKGKSPDTVKIALRKKGEDGENTEEDSRQNLEKEKVRIERTIASLAKRLKEIEKELSKTKKG